MSRLLWTAELPARLRSGDGGPPGSPPIVVHAPAGLQYDGGGNGSTPMMKKSDVAAPTAVAPLNRYDVVDLLGRNVQRLELEVMDLMGVR